MSGGIKDLYHPTILEHNKHPVHFEKWEDAPNKIEAYNPVCGDKFKIFLNIDNGIIKKATFHGYGCALSKAATSVLVQLIQGKNIEEARQVCHEYLRAMDRGSLIAQDPQEFEAFLGVKKFPSRKQCVILGWETVKRYLDNKVETS